jgi:hypothetical protein
LVGQNGSPRMAARPLNCPARRAECCATLRRATPLGRVCKVTAGLILRPTAGPRPGPARSGMPYSGVQSAASDPPETLCRHLLAMRQPTRAPPFCPACPWIVQLRQMRPSSVPAGQSGPYCSPESIQFGGASMFGWPQHRQRILALAPSRRTQFWQSVQVRLAPTPAPNSPNPDTRLISPERPSSRRPNTGANFGRSLLPGASIFARGGQLRPRRATRGPVGPRRAGWYRQPVTSGVPSTS